MSDYEEFARKRLSELDSELIELRRSLKKAGRSLKKAEGVVVAARLYNELYPSDELSFALARYDSKK